MRQYYMIENSLKDPTLENMEIILQSDLSIYK